MRNPNAGHAGAIGAKPRCKDCKHHRGLRIVSLTVKADKGRKAEPRFHKKPCDCGCHR